MKKKVSQKVLGAMAIGLATAAVTTACSKEERLEKKHENHTSPEDCEKDGCTKEPTYCPACGMG